VDKERTLEPHAEESLVSDIYPGIERIVRATYEELAFNLQAPALAHQEQALESRILEAMMFKACQGYGQNYCEVPVRSAPMSDIKMKRR
jgi:hypothetical protein